MNGPFNAKTTLPDLPSSQKKEKFFFADSVSDIFSMVLYKEEIGKSLFEKKPQMKMNSKKKQKNMDI